MTDLDQTLRERITEIELPEFALSGEDVARLADALRNVLGLHREIEYHSCAECLTEDADFARPVRWPCATVRIIAKALEISIND